MFSNPWKRSSQANVWDNIVDGIKYKPNAYISEDDWMYNSEKHRENWLREFQEEYKDEPLSMLTWDNWWKWIGSWAKNRANTEREEDRIAQNAGLKWRDRNTIDRINNEKERRKLQQRLYGSFNKFKIPYIGKKAKLTRQNATVTPITHIARGFARTWKSPYEVEKAKRLQAARFKKFHWNFIELMKKDK